MNGNQNSVKHQLIIHEFCRRLSKIEIAPINVYEQCFYCPVWVRVRVMMFNATFHNISVTNVYRGGKFYWYKKLQYP